VGYGGIIAIMQNHRTANQGRGHRNTSQEPERTAMRANNNGSLSKQSHNKQALAEKREEMVGKVMREVSRLHNPSPLRIITREMVREGGSKLFYDVFLILAQALDPSIELPDVNNEKSILALLRLFNYPGFVGKSIFQPIGAPHTWHHCLSILDFMADLARYASAFKAHTEEAERREKEHPSDQEYWLSQAALHNNPQIYLDVLAAQELTWRQETAAIEARAAELELQINLLLGQQKPLKELEREREAERRRREQNENKIMSLRVEKGRLEGSIAEGRKEIDKLKVQQAEADRQLDSLEYKLSHNELKEEEIERLKQEVRNGKLEQRALEEELDTSTTRIRDSASQSVSRLRESYLRVHTYLNDILAADPSAQDAILRASPVDNFDQLLDLCNGFLEEEDHEGTLASEFQRKAQEWQLEEQFGRADKVAQKVRDRVEEKHKQLLRLRRELNVVEVDAEHLRKQTRALSLERVKLSEALSQGRMALLEVADRSRQVQAGIEADQQQIEALKRERSELEEGNDGLMEQIEGVREEGEDFSRQIEAKLRVARQ
jgi:hypothetical protein